MFHEFFFYFKLFKPFNFFASSPSIDATKEGSASRMLEDRFEDLIVPIIQNERGHSQDPSLPSFRTMCIKEI